MAEIEELGRRRYQIANLQIVLKLSEICNLACSYCYYYAPSASNDWQSRPRFIGEDRIIEIAQWLRAFVQENSVDAIRIVLHGGEPTLLNPEVANFVCHTLRKVLSPFSDVTFSLQTNAYYISREFREVIRKHQISVGFSIDGPPAINDAVRVTHSGRPSSGNIRQTLKTLKREARSFDDSALGAICVVDADSNVDEIVHYILNELGADGINFLLDYRPPKSDGDGDQGARYASVLKRLFDLSAMNRAVEIRESKLLLARLRGAAFTSPATGQTRTSYPAVAITIHTDGALMLDDSMAIVLDWFETLPRSTIADISLADYLESPHVADFHHWLNTVPDDCRACKFANVCRGGRMHFRFAAESTFNNRSRYCASYYSFFEHILDSLSEAGMPQARIEAALR